MAIFINLSGIFVRFYRDQPSGCSLCNRTNLLQNLNKSCHKNKFKQLHYVYSTQSTSPFRYSPSGWEMSTGWSAGWES